MNECVKHGIGLGCRLVLTPLLASNLATGMEAGLIIKQYEDMLGRESALRYANIVYDELGRNSFREVLGFGPRFVAHEYIENRGG